MKLITKLAILVMVLLLAGTLPPAPIYGQQAPPSLRFLGLTPLLPESLRRALGYAIDREAVAQAMAAHTPLKPEAAFTIQHPRLPGFNASAPGYTYNREEAKRLFAESGWSGELTILTGARLNRSLEVFYEGVRDSLQSTLGITVRLLPVANFNVLVSEARAGRVPAFMFGWQSGTSDFGYPHFSLGLAQEFVSDPDVRRLLTRQDIPLEQRAKEVEELLLKRAWIIPVVRQ